MDHYYKDLPELTDSNRVQVNFDHPNSIDIDIPDSIALQRRIQRDTKSVEAVKRQFEQTVKPMFDQYIKPKAQFADVVLDGEQAIIDSMLKLTSSDIFTKLIYPYDSTALKQ